MPAQSVALLYSVTNVARTIVILEGGVVIPQEVDSHLQSVAERIRNANTVTETINASTSSQQVGIQAIRQNVVELGETVQASSQHAEQSASSAQELSSHAKEQSSQIGRFNVGEVRATADELFPNAMADKRARGRRRQAQV